MLERAEGDRKMCIHEIYQGRVKKVLAELGGKAMIFELLDSLNKDENWVPPSEAYFAITDAEGIHINFMEGSVELDEVSSEPDLTQA
jgi:hypothetical protein